VQSVRATQNFPRLAFAVWIVLRLWHFWQHSSKGKGKGQNIALKERTPHRLRSVTCHMGSHRVTCHPTEVNTPRL